MKTLNKMSRVLFFIGLLGGIFYSVSAQKSLRPPPLNTAPGIVEIQSTENGPVFVNLELDRETALQVITELPLTEIKGEREAGETRTIGCAPATSRLACLIDIVIDGQREIWLYRKANNEGEDTLIRIPERVISENFWSAPLTSLVGDGPLTFVSLPRDLIVPAQAWIENRGEGGDAFFIYDLPRANQLVMARPSFNGDALSGLFVILAPSSEPYLTSAEGYEMLAASADGSFVTYTIPAGCEVMGALNDVIICANNIRGRLYTSDHPQYSKVVWLNLPDGVEQDIARDGQQPGFHPLDNVFFIRGMANGVARPYVQDLNGEQAQMGLAGDLSCIGPNDNVDIFDLTASRKAALMRVFGPTTPARLVLAPIENERIHICSPSAKLFSQDPVTHTGESSYQVERMRLQKVDGMPVTMVSGATDGPLSGHVMLVTYGSAGITLPEAYLGPWFTHWVDKGGKVAFVHLPGGGGYGAQWSAEGFGVRNKNRAAIMLDLASAELIKAGFAQEGKIGLHTESAGGPVAAHAILRNPQRYSVLALRAACINIEGETRKNCANNYDFGNWHNPDDQALMDEYEPLEKIVESADFPPIVYGIPEMDSRLDLDYQRQIAQALSGKDFQLFEIAGVDHTDRASPAIEEQWAKLIAETAEGAR